jgi:hypothetical protein
VQVVNRTDGIVVEKDKFLYKNAVFRGLKRHGYQYVATNVANSDAWQDLQIIFILF